MSDKRRVIIGIIAAVLAIGLFGVCVHFIESRSMKEEQLGDSGDWGEGDEETILSFGDNDYVTNDNIDTYLLIGTDNGGDDKGEGFNGELADFITAIVIDNTTQSYAFYQIDRNTMVEVPIPEANGGGHYTEQICTAHWYGKTPEERNNNLVNAVSELLGGLEIKSYYTLNMNNIGKVNDAIGGVVVTIDSDMTAVDPEFKEGANILLTDGQAEKYLRARFALEDDSNASRMKRQEAYMQSAYNTVIGQLRENPEYISELYENLDGVFETDGSARDASVIADKFEKYKNMGMISFKGKVETNDTLGDGVEHEEFYVDESSILSGLKKVIKLQVSE